MRSEACFLSLISGRRKNPKKVNLTRRPRTAAGNDVVLYRHCERRATQQISHLVIRFSHLRPLGSE